MVRSLVLFLMLSLSSLSFANEKKLEFAPYSCLAEKIEGEWRLQVASRQLYVTSLNYNQTSWNFATIKERSLGICSEMGSFHPDEMFISIHFVEGTNLDFAGNACAFSGDNVRFISKNVPVKEPNQIAHATHKIIINNKEIEILHIAGMSPTIPENIFELCMRHVRDLTGHETIFDSRNVKKENYKFKMSKNSKAFYKKP